MLDRVQVAADLNISCSEETDGRGWLQRWCWNRMSAVIFLWLSTVFWSMTSDPSLSRCFGRFSIGCRYSWLCPFQCLLSRVCSHNSNMWPGWGAASFLYGVRKRFLVCGEADFLWLTDCGEMFWQPSHFGKYPQDWFQSAMTPWEVSNVARTSNFLQSPACNRQWIRFLFVSLFVWCLWDRQRVH